MREQIMVFWSILIAGMILMTAADPECRQAILNRYFGTTNYALYNDENNDRRYVSGSTNGREKRAGSTGIPVGQCRL